MHRNEHPERSEFPYQLKITITKSQRKGDMTVSINEEKKWETLS
jgi:hypothetical protein